jgi:hypothetical protein
LRYDGFCQAGRVGLAAALDGAKSQSTFDLPCDYTPGIADDQVVSLAASHF